MNSNNTITIKSNKGNLVSPSAAGGAATGTGTRKTKKRNRGGRNKRRYCRRKNQAMEQSKTAAEEAKKSEDNVEVVTQGINNSHRSQCGDNVTQSKSAFAENSEIRRWFVALSPKERMNALAFNDEQLLSVLFSLSLGKASSSELPSSSSLQDAGAVKTATERTPDRPVIDGE